MNKLPPHHLASFKKAYFESFGEHISDDDAHAMGLRLLQTLALMLKVNARTIHRAEKFDSRLVSDDTNEIPPDDVR